ncbi:MAG TPA: L-seryl-tRNA(Sec) selenium transferase [Gaiellaceae bacterium]|nr:L-seryl-tRNA(Sec) selenium transferase [Gaiellaceae bacterium]
MERRDLPSVDLLLRSPELAQLPRAKALAAARNALAEARAEIASGHDPGDIADRALALAVRQEAPRLRRVINATGVILHTNLGRAPLPDAAVERIRAAAGYSNVELDLGDGRRGSRQDHLPAILRRLTGAEDAIVVNNNAASLLLALTALAAGGEAIVSRGELIEIGDGFRIPDVLAQSGARLREVGTTNRTRSADYESAVGPETSLLLRVHQSNFRTVGFSERPSIAELVAVAQRHDLPLLDDLGSGSFVPLADEPLVRDSLAAGADLVAFSGDKLLGGPQAGIVAGRADLVGRLRRHPLQRALRPDKLTLAALEGTLLLYLEPERALAEVPVLRMIHEPLEEVRARAAELARVTGGDMVETTGRVGGGALPLYELPSAACSLEEQLAAALRSAAIPIVALVRDGRTVLDCRTVAAAEIGEIAEAVVAARLRLAR